MQKMINKRKILKTERIKELEIKINSETIERLKILLDGRCCYVENINKIFPKGYYLMRSHELTKVLYNKLQKKFPNEKIEIIRY